MIDESRENLVAEGQMDRQTDRQTDGQTDESDFVGRCQLKLSFKYQ